MNFSKVIVGLVLSLAVSSVALATGGNAESNSSVKSSGNSFNANSNANFNSVNGKVEADISSKNVNSNVASGGEGGKSSSSSVSGGGSAGASASGGNAGSYASGGNSNSNGGSSQAKAGDNKVTITDNSRVEAPDLSNAVGNAPSMGGYGSFSNDNCANAAGAAAGFAGGAFGVQAPIESEGCNRRRDAYQLANLGEKDSAIALLCQNEQLKKARQAAGHSCPGDANYAIESKRDLTPAEKKAQQDYLIRKAAAAREEMRTHGYK